jgi:hypothetical protein
MSTSFENQRPSRPVKAVRSVLLPPVIVDCSSWGEPDERDALPSRPPKSRTVHLPPVTVEMLPPRGIEIVLDPTDSATADDAFRLAKQLIHAVSAAAPELKLLYETDESRVGDDGRVTIVLTPQVYLADDSRLQELVDAINGGLCEPLPSPEREIAVRASVLTLSV